MTNMIVADVAAATAVTGQASTGAQPTAQAVSRFEQQLQSPASTAQFYQAPLGDAVGVHGNWQAVMGDVGKLSEQYRVDSMSVDGAPLAEQSSFSSRHGADPLHSAQVFQQGMTKLSHMSYTMMSIGFVSSAERLAGENIRSLFQLA
jgi:hypothetical protein